MNNMPWINSYPAGVRWDKDITPAPLQTILDNTVAKWPDRPAIDFMGKRLSYRELGDYVNRAACGLQQLGVKPGVHVGLYLPNTPHYIIAFFAVLKAGGTVVNYSPLDAAAVLEHKIEDSRTDFLITLDMAVLYPQMETMLGKTRLKKLIVGSMAEMTSAPDAVTAEMKAAKQLSEIVWDDRHVSFAKLLDNDGSLRGLSYCRSEGDDCCAPVHRGHHRPAQGRDANACEPDERVPAGVGDHRRYAACSGRRAGALARHAAAIPHLRTYGERSICRFRRVGDHSARALRPPGGAG